MVEQISAFSQFVFPLSFAISEPQKLAPVSDSEAVVWRASVKVGNLTNMEIAEYVDVLFLEDSASCLSYLMGGVEQDYELMLKWGAPEYALTNLRALNKLILTASQQASRWPLIRVFAGWEFSAQGRLMAAYARVRGLPQSQQRVGVSFLADDDQMQYTSIDLSHYGFDTIDELLSYDDFENQFHKRMAPNI